MVTLSSPIRSAPLSLPAPSGTVHDSVNVVYITDLDMMRAPPERATRQASACHVELENTCADLVVTIATAGRRIRLLLWTGRTLKCCVKALPKSVLVPVNLFPSMCHRQTF